MDTRRLQGKLDTETGEQNEYVCNRHQIATVQYLMLHLSIFYTEQTANTESMFPEIYKYTNVEQYFSHTSLT